MKKIAIAMLVGLAVLLVSNMDVLAGKAKKSASSTASSSAPTTAPVAPAVKS